MRQRQHHGAPDSLANTAYLSPPSLASTLSGPSARGGLDNDTYLAGTPSPTVRGGMANTAYMAPPSLAASAPSGHSARGGLENDTDLGGAGVRGGMANETYAESALAGGLGNEAYGARPRVGLPTMRTPG